MNTLVAGRMKEGKTTLALYLAREWSNGVVVWDSRHQIHGAVIVRDSEELQEAVEERDWTEGPIIYRPDGLELEEQFDEMCSYLFTPPERFDNFALVIDEASDMQSAHSIIPHLNRCIRQHPRSVLVVQTTHSLQDWHRASKDLMSALYCFRMQGRSLQAVIDYSDGSDELRETIRRLPRHHYVRIDFEAAQGEEEYSVHGDPERWYSPATERALPEREDEEEEATA